MSGTILACTVSQKVILKTVEELIKTAIIGNFVEVTNFFVERISKLVF